MAEAEKSRQQITPKGQLSGCSEDVIIINGWGCDGDCDGDCDSDADSDVLGIAGVFAAQAAIAARGQSVIGLDQALP